MAYIHCAHYRRRLDELEPGESGSRAARGEDAPYYLPNDRPRMHLLVDMSIHGIVVAQAHTWGVTIQRAFWELVRLALIYYHEHQPSIDEERFLIAPEHQLKSLADIID
jgi:hypothetical protein